MKLNKYIAMGLLACLPFSSCSYLDKEPDTEITIDMVFENKRNVESWLANIYDGIPNPSRGWLVGESWEIFADDLTPSYRWYQWEFSDLTKMVNGGTWTPNTKWGGNLWQRMPQKIREAYIFIERVHALPSDDLSEEEVNYMKAEARFLAAYYWWQLAETYGPIPFKPDYIAPTDFDLTELMVGQRPFDEVVNYCDQEMLAAAQQLPPVWQTNEKYGRITSVMALTIRAKMLLFAASPLVNGNEWYASHKNREGENLFSTTYDPNKWVRAAEACKMLICSGKPDIRAGWAGGEDRAPHGHRRGERLRGHRAMRELSRRGDRPKAPQQGPRPDPQGRAHLRENEGRLAPREARGGGMQEAPPHLRAP